jgi:hypothetical protein
VLGLNELKDLLPMPLVKFGPFEVFREIDYQRAFLDLLDRGFG